MSKYIGSAFYRWLCALGWCITLLFLFKAFLCAFAAGVPTALFACRLGHVTPSPSWGLSCGLLTRATPSFAQRARLRTRARRLLLRCIPVRISSAMPRVDDTFPLLFVSFCPSFSFSSWEVVPSLSTPFLWKVSGITSLDQQYFGIDQVLWLLGRLFTRVCQNLASTLQG